MQKVRIFQTSLKRHNESRDDQLFNVVKFDGRGQEQPDPLPPYKPGAEEPPVIVDAGRQKGRSLSILLRVENAEIHRQTSARFDVKGERQKSFSVLPNLRQKNERSLLRFETPRKAQNGRRKGQHEADDNTDADEFRRREGGEQEEEKERFKCRAHHPAVVGEK